MNIPAIIVAILTIGSATKPSKKVSGMTPERQKLFEALLSHQRDPKKLQKMAAKFDGEGLVDEATKLRRFAAICALPKEKKDERRAIFRKALASKNRAAVLNAAKIYDDDGCLGAAAALRKYGNGLPPI